MNRLCNEAVKTILEECQRFIFQTMLDGALDAIRKTLEEQVAIVGQAAWDGATEERRSFADRLIVMPDEPFQPTQTNVEYWNALIACAAALLNKLYGNRPPAALVEAVSILYGASQLLLEAVRSKVNKASAYALAIGAGTVAADTAPFQGPLPVQPLPVVKRAINTVLGAAPDRDLSYADLLEFLVDDLVVNRILDGVPQARQFMSLFTEDVRQPENEIMKLFLQNAGSFVPAAGGQGGMDPHETLRLLVGALDRFITDRFQQEALPRILDNVSDANIRLYIEEVLFEAVRYVKDVALRSLLNWEGKTFGNDEFTEALAGVMTLLLGRTVVIVADTFLTATQERIGSQCDAIAQKVRNRHDDVRIFDLPADPDFIRLAADGIQIAGEVLGPLPPETRGRIRQLLYQAFEPLPPGGGQDFLENLADDLFIPNEAQLRELTDELVAISQARFALFVEKLVLAVGNYVLEQLEDLLLQAIDLILNWEKHLAASLEDLAALLSNLETELTRLNGQVVALFQAADQALRRFFEALSGPSLKSQIKGALKDLFVDKGLGILADNDIYRNLPREIRRSIKHTLAKAIDGVMDNPLVDPVLNAVRHMADQLEELLLDCRELDPDDNLPEQVMLLVLDKIEDRIREHFGGTKPHVDVGLDFDYRDFFGNLHSVHIPLGRIEVNVNPFLNMVRDTIERLDFYHDQLDEGCFKLGKALAKELEAAAAELRKAETQKERQRLAKIAAEHDRAPREIVILNPTSLSNHSNAVDVKIHLGGVPLSFLGLGKDESQRVLLYLNGTLVPIKSLLVEESSTIPKSPAHLGDFDIGRSPLFDVESGILSNRVASLVVDTAKHYPAHAGNTKRTEAVRYVFSPSEYREQAVTKTLLRAGGRQGGKASVLSVDSRTDKKNRPIQDYAVSNVLPGRGNPASRIDDMLQARMAGVLLRFKVELNELVEGVNVLTVVVVERGGSRHQQNVSFTVTKKPTFTAPVGTRPGLPAGTGLITLRPIEAGSYDKRQPKKALTLSIKQRQTGRRGAGAGTDLVKALVPIDSKSLAKAKQQALTYLEQQDKLNLVRISLPPR
jgi:hypothetical protein